FDTNLEINADGTPVIPDTYSYKQFNNDEGLIWGEETYVIHDADNGITTTGSEDGKVTTVYANNTVTVLSPNGEFTTTYTSGYTTYGTLDDDGGLGVYNNAGDLLFTENPDQTVTYPADQSEY
ncbi:MAG: hypothetical protein U9Q15_00120, partial [Patescibacteria group bacterium]|nr:hypothetical protein [Patescibacteria group bacterium]